MIGLSVPLILAFLLALILWLVFYSQVHWGWKITTTVATFLLLLVAWAQIQILPGWPTNAPLPAVYRYHFAYVIEPGPQSMDGIIYLMASDLAEERRDSILGMGVDYTEPRIYRLPYSRPAHEQAQKLNERSANGEAIRMNGEAAKGEGKGGKDGVEGGSAGSEAEGEGEEGRGESSQGEGSGERGDGIPEDNTFGYELPPVEPEPKD